MSLYSTCYTNLACDPFCLKTFFVKPGIYNRRCGLCSNSLALIELSSTMRMLMIKYLPEIADVGHRLKLHSFSIIGYFPLNFRNHFIMVVKNPYRLESGVPYFFYKGISTQAWSCAHRIDDEKRPDGRKIRLGNHHQSGRALR